MIKSNIRCEIKASEPLVPYRETVLTPNSGVAGPGSNDNKGKKDFSSLNLFYVFLYGKFCYCEFHILSLLLFFIFLFLFLFLFLPLILSYPLSLSFSFSFSYSLSLSLTSLLTSESFSASPVVNISGVCAKILPPPWGDLSGLCDAVQGRVRLTSSSDYLSITVRCYPLPVGEMKIGGE